MCGAVCPARVERDFRTPLDAVSISESLSSTRFGVCLDRVPRPDPPVVVVVLPRDRTGEAAARARDGEAAFAFEGDAVARIREGDDVVFSLDGDAAARVRDGDAGKRDFDGELAAFRVLFID